MQNCGSAFYCSCYQKCKFAAVDDCFCRTGPFGEPENLDDLNDHWTSKRHLMEQLDFLKLLRDMRMKLQCGITILSGDVHTCCVQELRAMPQGPALGIEPAIMVNIVSSGMRHSPMPAVVAAFVKELPCQSDLALGGEGVCRVVPQQWQKVQVLLMCSSHNFSSLGR
jgi:hypothetical protein